MAISLLCLGSYGMNLGMGHHSIVDVASFYQGDVMLIGFFYRLNVVLTGAGHDSPATAPPSHRVRLNDGLCLFVEQGKSGPFIEIKHPSK